MIRLNKTKPGVFIPCVILKVFPVLKMSRSFFNNSLIELAPFILTAIIIFSHYILVIFGSALFTYSLVLCKTLYSFHNVTLPTSFQLLDIKIVV